MNKFIKNFGFWIVLIVMLFAAYYFMNSAVDSQNITFSELVSEIKNSNVETMEYLDNTLTVVIKNSGEVKNCYIPSLSMLYEHAGDSIKE